MSIPESWRGKYSPRDPLKEPKPRTLDWPPLVSGPQDGARTTGSPHDVRPIAQPPRRGS